jgi:type IV pilus assembly protein PilM
MFSTKKTSTVVGLDVEAGSVAAVELRGNGSPSIARRAIGDLPPGAVDDGEVIDTEAVSAVLRSMFSEHNLSKHVRLGVANQRVAVRMMHLPLIEDPEELDTAIRFQAQDELPMPLDEAVLDYQVVARHQSDDGDRTMDVMAVAARRDMVDSLAAALNGAGLKTVGIDLSAFAMIRALAGEGENGAGETETTLYCHFGDLTNLAVARGDACLFTRVSPFGLESIAGRLAERRELPVDEARRQLVVVGLEDDAPVEDEVEAAAARAVLEEGAGKLVGELRMSLDYYGAQEDVPPVERLVLCGPGSTIPGLADVLEDALGYRVDELRPAALAGLEDHEAARLTVSYGLALEEATA